MSISEEKRDFLLKDFSEISKLRNSYANMRLVALGTIMTLITGIVTFGKDTQYPNIFGIYAVLLLIVFTGIRIISAINRGLYVFIKYLQWVEKELGEIGFSSLWMDYIQQSEQDSGSYAFVVATRAMNFVISVYVVVSSFLQLRKDITIAVIPVLIAIAVCLWNEWHIHKYLNPKNFVKEINKKWISIDLQLRAQQNNP